METTPILSILIVTMATCITAANDKAQSVIVRSIEPNILQTGETAKIDCFVSDPSGYPVFFKKILPNGQRETLSGGSQIMIRNIDIGNGEFKYDVTIEKTEQLGVRMYRLIIRSVQLEDAGTYRCQIGVPEAINSPFKDGTLTVQRAPYIDKSLSTQGPVYAKEGDDVTLKCYANGMPKPQISWTRVNGKLLPTGNYHESGNVFVLKNVTLEHRGVYRCNADNRVPNTAKNDVEVVVYFPPKVKAFINHVGQMPDKNNKVILDCMFSGYPDPVIRWYKIRGTERVRIMKSSKFEITETTPKGPSDMLEGDTFSSLIIWNVQSGDIGSYSCVGESETGSHADFIKLYGTPTCQGPLCQLVGRPTSGSTNVRLQMSLLSLTTLFVIVSIARYVLT